jgi:hypothetical protein
MSNKPKKNSKGYRKNTVERITLIERPERTKTDENNFSAEGCLDPEKGSRREEYAGREGGSSEGVQLPRPL